MKLSDGEKLIILMLSELYENLGIDGEIDPEFIRSAIFSDNLWGVPWKYSGIPFDQQESPQVVKDVMNILDMWSFIEESYERLSEKERAYLGKEAEPFGKNPVFQGFDGNNETDHMGVALFIINDLERFERFKRRSLNSHAPSIDSYHRMLTVFSEYRKNLTLELLSVEQLAAILKERLHVSRR